MKKFFIFGALFLGTLLFFSTGAEAAQLYRAYNPNTGEHLYTLNANEIPFIVNAGWTDEKLAWEAPNTGIPVHRLFNPNNGGDHHYTLNTYEKDDLVNKGWRYEGVSWQSGGSIPVYRAYNPNAKSGAHHFTTDLNEIQSLKNAGWNYEGIAFYGGNNDNSVPEQNQTPPTKPQQVEKWSVWFVGDSNESQAYNIAKGTHVFTTEAEATEWIDNYADSMITNATGVSGSWGVYSFWE